MGIDAIESTQENEQAKRTVEIKTYNGKYTIINCKPNFVLIKNSNFL